MPNIPFPSIPNLPGVPAIPRSPDFPPEVQATLGAIQGALWSVLQTDLRWGIFNVFGEALANPSQFTGLTATVLNSVGMSSTYSTASVDYSKEVRVSDFPIEQGSFANYNKVETPAEATVVLAFAGSEAERAQFLSAIDDAVKSVELFNVVTPEATYIDYSISSYRYGRHSDKGATLLVVELQLVEIRQVSALYAQSGSNLAPKNPNAETTLTSGKVQPLNSAASVITAIGKKIATLTATVIKSTGL